VKNPFLVLVIAVHGQLEEFGAILEPHLKLALELPGLEIVRREESHSAFLQVQHHDPVAGRVIPDDFRIAVGVSYVRDDGVAFVGREGSAAVVAVGDGLAEGFAVGPGASASCGGIDGHDRILFARLETGRVVLVHDGGPGVDRAQMIRINRAGQFLPMDEVGAYCMAPHLVDIVPAVVPTVRVVLVVEVILAVVVDQAVGVVEPSPLGREVELGPERLAVEVVCVANVVFDRNAVEDVSAGERVLVRANEEFFAHPGTEVGKYPEVDIVRGQFNIHGADLFPVHNKLNIVTDGSVLDREVQHGFRDLKGAFEHGLLRRDVALKDVANDDLGPVAVVDDPNAGGLPFKIDHVPGLPEHGVELV